MRRTLAQILRSPLRISHSAGSTSGSAVAPLPNREREAVHAGEPKLDGVLNDQQRCEPSCAAGGQMPSTYV